MRAPARPRLLFVVPDLKGGGAPRVTLALLGALDPARYAITLLNLGEPGAALESAVPDHVRLRQRPGWLRGLFGARLATLWWARDADLLVAAVEMRATFCVHFAARWLRKPALAWVHIDFERWVAGFGARHQRRSRAAYRDIAGVIFVAAAARAAMARWLGGDGAHWRSIPNLFRAAAYADAPLRPAQQALLARVGQRPTVLGVGRLEARKGFEALIEACAQARRDGLDFDLVILGEGERREALTALARDRGVPLALPGHVANPLPWLRAATVYALSSRLEGLPTTILEAFACDTPVIATDCPTGPAELLADGAGLLVPMDDVAALAEAIARLLTSPALRARLVAQARAQLPRYAEASVLPQWQAAIEEALAGSSPRR